MATKKRVYEQYKEYYRKKREEASKLKMKMVRQTHPAPEWKPIPKFSNYMISRQGVIINKYGKTMKPGVIKANGYLHVMLTGDDKKPRHIYIHQAVWNTFNGEKTPGMMICHVDANPANNKLSNLREMTAQENLNKSVTRKKRKTAQANRLAYQRLTTYKYDSHKNLIKVYDRVQDVEQDGHSISSVSMCCSGKQKTHQGFIFTHKIIN